MMLGPILPVNTVPTYNRMGLTRWIRGRGGAPTEADKQADVGMAALLHEPPLALKVL